MSGGRAKTPEVPSPNPGARAARLDLRTSQVRDRRACAPAAERRAAYCGGGGVAGCESGESAGGVLPGVVVVPGVVVSGVVLSGYVLSG